MSKKNPFIWSSEQDNAFSTLKKCFSSHPILVYFDPNKEVITETDASTYAIGGVISQYVDNKLHPVAFFSRKLKDAERNYTVYDLELLAIVSLFKEYRHYLLGTKFPIKVFTDHRNLLFEKKPEHLSPRHIRWSEFLGQFDFKILHKAGNSNGKADALSRRHD